MASAGKARHLDRFVAAAHARVDAGYYDPVGPALAPHGSLADALVSDARAVIAEVKPRSPSEGRILSRSVADLLADYAWGGATALSVLTDPDYFDGSIDNLRAAHALCVPTLLKDFVVQPEQVAAAAHNGASAILIIERLFAGDSTRREDLIAASHAAGLEVLLEVCNDDEADAVAGTAADLIGVNARDLDTLRVDVPAALQTVRRLAHRGHRVVALSGIASRFDRHAAVAAGAIGVLVGSSLVKAPDAGLWLRALRRPLAKVCGLTRPQDVVAAADAGADLAGFVVGAPGSPRNIGTLRAQQLIEAARAAGLRTVLVTPHRDDWEVREWCRIAKPDFVQIHGWTPTPEWIHSLGMVPTRVLLARRPDDDAPVPEGVVGLVFDTPRADGATGGAGTTHDWTVTRDRANDWPGLSLVAGGLGPDNVAAAIDASRTWGADASSGLEMNPGHKDPARVAAFVAATHDTPVAQ